MLLSIFPPQQIPESRLRRVARLVSGKEDFDEELDYKELLSAAGSARVPAAPHVHSSVRFCCHILRPADTADKVGRPRSFLY